MNNAAGKMHCSRATSLTFCLSTQEKTRPRSYPRPFVPEGKRGILACNLANGELGHWRGLYRRSSFIIPRDRGQFLKKERIATKIFPFCLTHFYLVEIFSANEFEKRSFWKEDFKQTVPVNSFVKKWGYTVLTMIKKQNAEEFNSSTKFRYLHR